MGLVALPPAIITGAACAALDSGLCSAHWGSQKGPQCLYLFAPRCAGYCSRGSLYDCLAAAREQPELASQLTWQRRLAMAVDAGSGLCYLHRRSIIHRDGAVPWQRGCCGLQGRNNKLHSSLSSSCFDFHHCCCRTAVPAAVKSPNLLVDEAWRVQVAGERKWLMRACLHACCTHGVFVSSSRLPQQAATQPSPNLHLALPDFNLAKILQGAHSNGSMSTTGVTNPVWLVSAGQAAGGTARGHAKLMHICMLPTSAQPAVMQAPEVLDGEAATPASDVYSFGMVGATSRCLPLCSQQWHQCAVPTVCPVSLAPAHSTICRCCTSC